MNSSTSYRTWIGFNDNSEGGITVYSVACYLSQGLQVDVFAFKNDAYLNLVDQAEGLTDEQRDRTRTASGVARPRGVLDAVQ